MHQQVNAVLVQDTKAAAGVEDPSGAAPRGCRRFNVMQWLVLIGLAWLSYFGVSRVGIQVVEVVGTSMQPTLRQSDHYLLKKWVYVFRTPHRNEIVVLADPDDAGYSVKRVIAVGGETVSIKEGDVYVNGIKLEEPYLPPGTVTFGAASLEQEYHCGKDEYFVLGDNRKVSLDSRTYGPVPRHNILGLIAP